jgi:DNA-binding MarR family transcriptional regulator
MKRGKLQDELQKRNPFEQLEQEAFLNLVRTSDRLQTRFNRLYREHGLTSAQYNLLRILRGEGRPMCSMQVAGRMITEVPGITGLIDRLERGGLVERERSAEDRRVVMVAITPKGLETLAGLDELVMARHRDLLGHLDSQELRTLIRLLEKAREPLAE